MSTENANLGEEKDPNYLKSVIAVKTAKKQSTKPTTPRNISIDTAAEMEEYFRVRRKQALESAAEEEKRDKTKKSGGRRIQNNAKLYREYLTKNGEARKGIGVQISVSEITRSVYKNGGVSPLGPPTESENIDNSTENVSTFRHLLYSSEEVTERPGPDGPGPPVVKYKLALNCLSRGARDTKVLEMWKMPKTGFAIKVRCGVSLVVPREREPPSLLPSLLSLPLSLPPPFSCVSLHISAKKQCSE